VSPANVCQGSSSTGLAACMALIERIPNA